jgi:hypothetical protein
VDTSAYRVLALAGYTFDFAKGRAGVGANFGFAYDAFILGTNDRFTTTKYASLRPGIVVRVAILRELLQTQLDAGFRIPLSVGALDPAFGNFSAKVVESFDAGLSLFGELPIGLVYAARGGVTRYAYSFSGMGTLADGTDGTDLSWNLTGQLGWRLR